MVSKSSSSSSTKKSSVVPVALDPTVVLLNRVGSAELNP